jgi:hypothetical protein
MGFCLGFAPLLCSSASSKSVAPLVSLLHDNHRYDHVERAVFLCQPNDNGWGVVKKGSVPLTPGQTYAALLARRPGNYLGLRVLRPLVSPWLCQTRVGLASH